MEGCVNCRTSVCCALVTCLVLALVGGAQAWGTASDLLDENSGAHVLLDAEELRSGAYCKRVAWHNAYNEAISRIRHGDYKGAVSCFREASHPRSTGFELDKGWHANQMVVHMLEHRADIHFALVLAMLAIRWNPGEVYPAMDALGHALENVAMGKSLGERQDKRATPTSARDVVRAYERDVHEAMQEHLGAGRVASGGAAGEHDDELPALVKLFKPLLEDNSLGLMEVPLRTHDPTTLARVTRKREANTRLLELVKGFSEERFWGEGGSGPPYSTEELLSLKEDLLHASWEAVDGAEPAHSPADDWNGDIGERFAGRYGGSYSQMRDTSHTILFSLTEEQRLQLTTGSDISAIHEVGVRFSGKNSPPALVHLRGKSKLSRQRCPRRSFDVYLRAPVRIGYRGVPLLAFSLHSLCEDNGGVNAYTALNLVRGMGLFPPFFRLVELRFGLAGEDGDGAGMGTQGMYLLIEKPGRAVKKRCPDNKIMFRREASHPLSASWFETAGMPTQEGLAQLNRPDGADSMRMAEATKPYFAAVNNIILWKEGKHRTPSLLAETRRSFHIDQYLTWLAANSLLQNADYANDLWVYDCVPAETRELIAQHIHSVHGEEASLAREPPSLWTIMAWGFDKLGEPCARPNSVVAASDPLLYCAEARLDEALMSDPAVRAKYIHIIRRLIHNALSPERVEEEVARTTKEVDMYWALPGVPEVMMQQGTRPGYTRQPHVAAEEFLSRYRVRVAEVEEQMRKETKRSQGQ